MSTLVAWFATWGVLVGPAPAPDFAPMDRPEAGPPPADLETPSGSDSGSGSDSDSDSASGSGSDPASGSGSGSDSGSGSGSASASGSGSDSASGSDSGSDSGSASASASDSEIRQPEPPEAEERPATRAIGGQGHTPLPPAPPRRDPTSLESKPWRGRGWFDVRVDALIPVGGQRPARGNVVSVTLGFDVGWRLHEVVGLYSGVTTFVHDETVTTTEHVDGSTRSVQGVGRSVLFDVAVMRLWLPVGRRVQPWADVGGGVGVYRPPFAPGAQAFGAARTGLGVDFWLAPTMTMTVGSAYRLFSMQQTLGHAISMGVEFGVHW